MTVGLPGMLCCTCLLVRRRAHWCRPYKKSGHTVHVVQLHAEAAMNGYTQVMMSTSWASLQLTYKAAKRGQHACPVHR
jgi:hypothetical protein